MNGGGDQSRSRAQQAGYDAVMCEKRIFMLGIVRVREEGGTSTS